MSGWFILTIIGCATENTCAATSTSRLASDARMGQAQAEMTLVAGRLSTLHDPHSDLGKLPKAVIWPGSPFPYSFKLYGGLEYAILLITAGVGMVLVIACANVASLQLARAASRQNELGLRPSLGASRLRIIRQLLATTRPSANFRVVDHPKVVGSRSQNRGADVRASGHSVT